MASISQIGSLLRNEELYNEIFHKNPSKKLLIDVSTLHIMDVNAAAVHYYGYDKDTFIAMNLCDLNANDSNKLKREGSEILCEKTGRNRFHHRLADGTLRFVEMYTSRVQLRGQDCLYAIISDVSEHVAREEKLRFGEQLFHQFVSKAPVTMAMFDTDMNYLLASERWMVEITDGNTKLQGRNHYEILKNQPPHWIEAHQRAMKGHAEKIEQDIFIRPNGKLDWVRWEVLPWYKADNSTGGVIIFIEMITQRKKVDEISSRLIEQRSRMAARVETIEDERRNIARELHDGLGQLLTAAHLNMELVEQSILSDPQEAINILKRAKKVVTTTIQEVRNISQNLRPAVLDDFGLVPALRNLCDDFSRTGSLNVQFSEYELNPHYSPAIEIVVYRICQEALNNIVRHSGATEANIDIYNRESNLLIVIQDNGHGFDVARIAQSKSGTGLLNIRERAELLGGSVQIESQADNGTEIIIEIPIKSQNDSPNTHQEYE
jgi:PAS domain S-box-containing protein